MKKLILLSFFALAGCGVHVEPIAPKFPDAPDVLRQECAKLKEATEGMTLSEYTKTVVDNYMLYHECSLKVTGWNEWYARQKEIFENATK